VVLGRSRQVLHAELVLDRADDRAVRLQTRRRLAQERHARLEAGRAADVLEHADDHDQVVRRLGRQRRELSHEDLDVGEIVCATAHDRRSLGRRLERVNRAGDLAQVPRHGAASGTDFEHRAIARNVETAHDVGALAREVIALDPVPAVRRQLVARRRPVCGAAYDRRDPLLAAVQPAAVAPGQHAAARAARKVELARRRGGSRVGGGRRARHTSAKASDRRGEGVPQAHGGPAGRSLPQ
jgi:hypothetical protein